MSRKVNGLMLTLMIGFLTLSGGVAMSGGMTGQFPGFHANEKGYPGWCPNDQHVKPMDEAEVITIELSTVDDSNGNFHGAGPIGEYPGGRPGP